MNTENMADLVRRGQHNSAELQSPRQEGHPSARQVLPMWAALAGCTPIISLGREFPLVRGHPRWGEQEDGLFVLLEVRRGCPEATAALLFGLRESIHADTNLGGWEALGRKAWSFQWHWGWRPAVVERCILAANKAFIEHCFRHVVTHGKAQTGSMSKQRELCYQCNHHFSLALTCSQER